MRDMYGIHGECEEGGESARIREGFLEKAALKLVLKNE